MKERKLSWETKYIRLERHYSLLQRTLDQAYTRARGTRARLQHALRRIKEMSHEIQLLGSARWQAKPVLKSRGDVRADSARYTESVRPGNGQGPRTPSRIRPQTVSIWDAASKP